MTTSLPPILGMPPAAWIAAATAAGLTSGDARALNRAAFSGPISDPRVVDQAPAPIVTTVAEGATRKFVQRHADGRETETVILPLMGRARPRHTLCVSSQVGCALGCVFCETAQMGLVRNLSVAEIVGQWHAARFALDSPVSNVVFMGMGEPMENLDAVIGAIRVLADARGGGLAAARIAVSTAGRTAGMRRLAAFAAEPGFHKLRLAVSVNAPTDALRSQLMPINRAEPLAALREAIAAWPATATRPVMIEYVLISGVNDATAHATTLAAWLRGLHAAVNVIPLNPRTGSDLAAPAEATVDAFLTALRNAGQIARRRITTGRDALAACGQLGNAALRPSQPLARASTRSLFLR